MMTQKFKPVLVLKLVGFYICLFSNLYGQHIITHTSSTGYTISCKNPTVVVTSVTNLPTGASFTYASKNYTSTGATLTTTISGQYTVTAVYGNYSATTIFTVYPKLVPEPWNIPPNPLTCDHTGELITFYPNLTGNNPYGSSSPYKGTVIGGNGLVVSGFSIYTIYPGLHTFICTDTISGCKATITTTLTEKKVIPMLESPAYYTMTCPNGTVNLNYAVPSNYKSMVQFSAGPSFTIFGPGVSLTSPGSYTMGVKHVETGCYRDYYFSIWECVGLDKNVSETALHYNQVERALVFSSPVTGELQIISSDGKYNLVSLSGANQYNLNHLSNGIYYFRLWTNSRVTTTKLVVEE